MAKNKNCIEEMHEKAQALIQNRDKQIRELSEKIDTCQNKMTAAETAIQTAKDNLDFDGAEDAKKNKERAAFEIDAYKAKLKKYQSNDLITTAESDSMVENVLEYRDSLNNDLLKGIAAHIVAMNDLIDDYDKEINKIGNALREWTGSVHPYMTSQYGFNNGKFSYPVSGFVPVVLKEIRDNLNEIKQDSPVISEEIEKLTK